MVIHGGISEDSKTLDDMCVFDVETYTWTQAEVSVKEDVKSKKAN